MYHLTDIYEPLLCLFPMHINHCTHSQLQLLKGEIFLEKIQQQNSVASFLYFYC
uniref:Uncharacterized protein n=1 Tax=Lepeophtheirus salmonis TaxID=72036 RepID=A0A0K2U2H8_LEPSM